MISDAPHSQREVVYYLPTHLEFFSRAGDLIGPESLTGNGMLDVGGVGRTTGFLTIFPTWVLGRKRAILGFLPDTGITTSLEDAPVVVDLGVISTVSFAR